MASKSVARPSGQGAPPHPHGDTHVLPGGLSVVELAVVILATIALVAAMRVAEPFLVPVITGILLSYTLRPLVSLLERIHVPRAAAAALIIALLIGLVSATGYAIRDDVNAAVAELPVAARKLRYEVADAARRSPSPMAHMKDAATELDKAAAEASGKPASPSRRMPTSTDDVAGQFQEFVAQQSAKALTVLAEIMVALLVAMFLLAAGDTFRRKVTRIAGASLARRRVTVEVLNEIDGQIQAYMMTLLIANVLIGLITWVALLMLKVPNAGMWGIVTGILHIIPYAGTVVSSVAIGVAEYLNSGNVSNAVIALGVVAAIAALISTVLGTWMQGRAARMNAVAVFVGVLFFGWLWGGWGLLLGTPMLAVLKSIADRLEALHPLSELLSD